MNSEKELYESIENNEWKSVKNFYDLSNDFKKAAESMHEKREDRYNACQARYE